MKQQLRYYFNTITHCNMCGSPADTHKILGKRLNGSQGKTPKRKMGITTTVVKCSDCGLIYSNPQPIPFDLQDHYGVPPENYWKDDYFTVKDDALETEINILKSLTDIKEGMRSLDIGAGLGKSMIALKRIGIDAHGLEASRSFHERAISKMGISPDKLKLGMIENASYPENYFDFITFGAVLEHLYDPSDSILKALKWLKPNGLIHIEVPSADWLTSKINNFFYKLVQTDYVTNLSPMHEPYHLYEFSLKSFTDHAKMHNYDIAFSEVYVCETYLPKIADFILKPYMKRTNTGMILGVWLRKRA